MMKQYDVVALGELLIDFTDNGLSAQGNPVLEANPGGAVCNVLSMLSRFQRKTAYIGKVGRDGFGTLLESALKEQTIDTRGLRFDDTVHTTLAIVLTKEDGDRDFAFYRNPGADICLTAEEVDYDLIRNCSVFHFGSLSLTDEPVRTATIKALQCAKEAHCLISFDPNLREPLWKDLQQAHDQIHYGLQQADILKISDNEIQWFTGKQDFEEGIAYLKKNYTGLKLICLSKGKDGSCAYTSSCKVEVPAFLQENTIETTGAGDTFCACVLETVLEKGLDGLDEDTLQAMLVRANAAASIVTTRKGALRVMPSQSEIQKFIK